MTIKLPLHQMAGAPWNILDDTGRCVAICHGNDLVGDASAEDRHLAALIVEAVNAHAAKPSANQADAMNLP